MKSKIIKITAFLLLVIVGCFITFHFSNKEKVKADTPSLYYFDIDTSHENYMTIILYVLDVANIENNSCNLIIYGSRLTPPYQDKTSQTYNIQFLRNTDLDHNDYDAYIYNFSYPSINDYKPLMIYVRTYNTISFDNNTKVNYDLFLPYYPTFKEYYDNGHDDGYQEGYQDGTNDRNAYWENYIEETYESTTGSGYQRIFEAGRTKGYRQGQESIDTTDWLQTVATDVGSILNIKLMPFITIGGLIFIPLMFTILGAILWIWRKK